MEDRACVDDPLRLRLVVATARARGVHSLLTRDLGAG